MTYRGIQSFYDLTTKIKDILQADENTNTVTFGDITEVDLNKQTIFPLSHIIINSVTDNGQTLSYNISVMAMDIVDTSKDATTDIFVGNDNRQDVLNTQLSVLNRMHQKLRKGTPHQDGYHLEGSASLEAFFDRFENELAGWVSTFDVVTMNNIDICN
jgi:hypothetical protein